jgi:hypothetical protein
LRFVVVRERSNGVTDGVKPAREISLSEIRAA